MYICQDFFKKQIQKKKEFSFPYNCTIEEGAIHAYAKLNPIARQLIVTTRREVLVYERDKVYECIIPKGTKYWVGNKDDICAKKIIYKKEIDLLADERCTEIVNTVKDIALQQQEEDFKQRQLRKSNKKKKKRAAKRRK